MGHRVEEPGLGLVQPPQLLGDLPFGCGDRLEVELAFLPGGDVDVLGQLLPVPAEELRFRLAEEAPPGVEGIRAAFTAALVLP